MKLHHGMFPLVEIGSYLFISTVNEKPIKKISFLNTPGGWINVASGKVCALDRDHECHLVSMDMTPGTLFRHGVNGESFEFKDGDWQPVKSRTIFTKKSASYPLMTTACPELPAGTILYRSQGPGKWLKQSLLVDGNWESKDFTICPKKSLCHSKLPSQPIGQDCITSPCGQHKFTYDFFNREWTYVLGKPQPTIASEVINLSGNSLKPKKGGYDYGFLPATA